MRSPLSLRVRNRAMRMIAALSTPTSRTGIALVRLGSEYGGWWVPRDCLAPGTVAYCVGAGEDITFDLALHEAGCVVRVFDPTPRAISYVEARMPNSDHFTFRPVGVWRENTELRFYAPATAGFVSHSVVNLYGTTSYFTAPVLTLRSLMAAYGDPRVDMLKLDIEGAELIVLDSLLADGPTPSTICVEFDQPQPIRGVIRTSRKLRDAGYALVKIDRWNYTFVR